MKSLKECNKEDLIGSSYNMYLFAIQVIGGKLSDDLHKEMKIRLNKKDEFAIAYFNFLKKTNRKNSSVFLFIRNFFDTIINSKHPIRSKNE